MTAGFIVPEAAVTNRRYSVAQGLTALPAQVKESNQMETAKDEIAG